MASNKNHATALSPWQVVNDRTQSALSVEWRNQAYSLPVTNYFGLFDTATDPRRQRGSAEKGLQGQRDNGAPLLSSTIGDIASQPQLDGVIRIQHSAALPNQGKSTAFPPILNSSLASLANGPTHLTNQQPSRLIQEGQMPDRFATSISDGDWPAVDAGGRNHGLRAATVLSPWTPINGRSQSALSVEWWKRVYSLPVTNHFGLFDDATDPRGKRGSVEKAAQGQLNNGVLLIGGAFGDLASEPQTDGVIRVQRSIALPNQGRSTIFLPIINGLFDNLVIDPKDPNNLTGNLTGQELRQLIRDFFAPASQGGQVSKLFASVDGKTVEKPLKYRQSSLKAFDYKTPYPVKDSLLSAVGYTEETYLDNAKAPPVQLKDLAKDGQLTISPAVSDGYWLAVDVRGGAHELRFGGALGDAQTPFFSLDVSYQLLNPIHGSQKMDVLTGSDERDYLDGGDSSDALSGGKADDLLIGGGGDDVIDGGPGSDELWGDAGSDLFQFGQGYGADTIFDFSAGDQVRILELQTPPMVSEVVMASGVGTQIDFGQGDSLTFIGLRSTQLLLQDDLISIV